MNSFGTVSSASAFAISPDDNADLPKAIRAIYVGGAGNISVIFNDDTVAVTLSGLVVGHIYPLNVKRIRLTGTTATNLVGLI